MMAQKLLEHLESRLLASTTPLGVNLETLSDSARSFMFVDAMRSARTFGSAATPWDTSAPLDAGGWPTQDAGSCVITLGSPTLSLQDQPDISGTYHFSAAGKATLATVASSAWVLRQSYDALSNTTTADVVVNPGATQLFLSFTGTQGGLKNIRLIRPGYAADTTQEFTDAFLAHIAPFQTLRLMDFLATNTSKISVWSERTTPAFGVQTDPNRGAALEYGVDLANLTGKDLWVNIPVRATADYIQNLAVFLKNNLHSPSHVYLEYGNELWNSGFSDSFWYNYNAAGAEAAANPALLNYDHSNNTYYWAWRRVAEEIKIASDIFSGVYGAGNSTVRPVLASQIGNAYLVRDQLDFLAQNFGPVSSYLYAIAGAPYLNLGNLQNDTTLTVDQVLSGLEANLSWIPAAISKYTDLASYYGLQNLNYEGGIDLAGTASLSSRIAANYDPRMGTILSEYLQSVYGAGVAQQEYYEIAGTYTGWGSWGLTENVAHSSVKLDALGAFAAGSAPAPSSGVVLPVDALTLPASAYLCDHYQSSGSGKGDLGYLVAGNTFDYLLQTPTSAAYDLTLSTSALNAGGQVGVYLDGKLLSLQAVPASGSWTLYSSLPTLHLLAAPLAAGYHTLRLSVVTPGFNLHNLDFKHLIAPAVVTGLSATYFNDSTLTTAVYSGVDPAINFAWNSTAPAPGVNADRFSVSWRGYLVAPTTGSYTLQTSTDRGVRLWVNGQLLINTWGSAQGGIRSVKVNLTAGVRMQLQMDYQHWGKSAVASLSWQSATQAMSIIPTAAFVPLASSQSAPAALSSPAPSVGALPQPITIKNWLYQLTPPIAQISQVALGVILEQADRLKPVRLIRAQIRTLIKSSLGPPAERRPLLDR